MGLPAPFYDRDGITIFCGNATTIVPRLPRESVHAIVTSPPYNQLDDLPETGSGLWGKSEGGAGFLRAWTASGYADAMGEPEYQQWQLDLFSEARRIATDGASLFYNHQLRWRGGECLHPAIWFRPEGWRLRTEVVWDRGGGMMLNARMFCRYDERILWFVNGKSWTWNQECVGYGTVWRIARRQQQQGKRHPVAFPPEIPKRCILAATERGDCVLDLFGGEGTTAVVAKQLGRRCIMVEQDEQWCAVAVQNLQQKVFQWGGAS